MNYAPNFAVFIVIVLFAGLTPTTAQSGLIPVDDLKAFIGTWTAANPGVGQRDKGDSVKNYRLVIEVKGANVRSTIDYQIPPDSFHYVMSLNADGKGEKNDGVSSETKLNNGVLIRKVVEKTPLGWQENITEYRLSNDKKQIAIIRSYKLSPSFMSSMPRPQTFVLTKQPDRARSIPGQLVNGNQP